MSLAFFKKAFGIRKIGDGKEFDDFLRQFERPDVLNYSRIVRSFKRKAVRFIVIGYEGRKVFFDSLSYKDTPRSLPVFFVGSQQLSLTDYVFGSYSLNTGKDLLYSVKVHDFSSSGQLLITRFLNDIDDWHSVQTSGKRYPGNKRPCSSSVPQMATRSEPSLHNSVVACFLINIEQTVNHSSGGSTNKPGPSGSTPVVRRGVTHTVADEKQTPVHSTTNATQKFMEASPRRFYRTLFEHCAFLSVLIETLVTEAFTALSKVAKGHWGSGGFLTESECCDVISCAYTTFLNSFLDFCAPRLHFPVWSSLSNALTLASEASCCSIDEVRSVHVTSWLNMNIDSPAFPITHGVSERTTHDTLSNLFIRGCVTPLLSRGGDEHRYFLGQLITGVLILHPGWVASLVSSAPTDSVTFPITPLHSSGCASLPNLILSQMLTQAGCTDINLECLGGSIFNCTVLTGQSKKYLLALLYFVTYFLRFTCVMSTNEFLPDLGRADLFELEQQRRQPRLGSKTRRKSGSAAVISGDSHDSGISSQEDLTVSVYSASTGSSPTHASGMALCMPTRLTRDQCLIAQLAAQRMVSQEAAAAASGLQQHASTTGTAGIGARPTTDGATLHDPSALASGFTNPPVGPSHARYTEIPLLIEKFVDDQDELCACLPMESYPGQHLSTWHTEIPTSPSGLLLPKGMSDSSPALTIGTGPSRASSFSYAASPRSNASSVGASNSRQAELSRGGHSLGHSSTETPCITVDPPASPQITSHSLIGNSIFDRYCSGLALQATSESVESFRDRLCEHLNQWLQLGPLVLRGMNLSTRKSQANQPSDAQQAQSPQPGRNIQWCASGLIANTDSRTVEIMTLRRPSARDSKDAIEPFFSSSRTTQSHTVRHSFSQPGSRWSGRPDLLNRESAGSKKNSIASDYPVSKTVHPSPMVLHMLDRVLQVSERASCSALALRDLEGALYLIYARSRVLADLVTKLGHSVLQKTDWMATAVGCSPHDIPLLLATASSYCHPAAVILYEHHSDWWLG